MSATTRFSAADLTARRPVWVALSDLFLDTSLDATDLDRIATVLAASPYSLRELDDIFLWEVYPVLHWNLLSMAGEWAGFDGVWLEQQILAGRSIFSTLWTGTLGRLGTRSSVSWKHVRRELQHQRGTAGEVSKG